MNDRLHARFRIACRVRRVRSDRATGVSRRRRLPRPTHPPRLERATRSAAAAAGRRAEGPKVIAVGEALWKDNCAHCHGSKAYPGKAPKLQPTKYKAEFVWDRVHNGFRSMPPWKELYKPEEVIALVAWVMSEEFWP